MLLFSTGQTDCAKGRSVAYTCTYRFLPCAQLSNLYWGQGHTPMEKFWFLTTRFGGLIYLSHHVLPWYINRWRWCIQIKQVKCVVHKDPRCGSGKANGQTFRKMLHLMPTPPDTCWEAHKKHGQVSTNINLRLKIKHKF